MVKPSMRYVLAAMLLLSSLAAHANPAPVFYTLGAPLSQPEAIAVDECGRLIVLDSARTALMRFDLNGRLDKVVADGDVITTYVPVMREGIYSVSGGRVLLGPVSGPRQQLRMVNMQTPESTDIALPDNYDFRIAAADNGEYYVQTLARTTKIGKAPAYQRQLQAFSPNGKLRTAWDCPKLHSFSVGPNGNVYANEYGTNKIFVYTRTGKLLRTFDLKELLPPNTGNVWRVVADRNGDIYAFLGGNIARISADGKTARVICHCGPRHAAFQSRTSGAYVEPDFTVRDGLIYVLIRADQSSEVQVITPDGQCVAVYASPVPKLNMPGAIAIQPDGSYAVQQCGGMRHVLMFNPDDSPIGEIPIQYCGSVAACAKGGYYTANKYYLDYSDATGKSTKHVLHNTVETKQLGHTSETIMPVVTESAEHVAVDPSSGNLWALAYGYPKCRFVAFGPDDSVLRRVYLDTSGIRGPGDFAVDPAGYLYVSCAWQDSVVKYDFEGKRVAVFGKTGAGIGELHGNNGIVLDKSGRIYVADTGNSRIQVFTRSGESLGVWPGPADKPLCKPLGVAIGPNETLWVTDTLNDRIVRVPLDDFWRQVVKNPVPAPAVQAQVSIAAPTPGSTTVTGVVIAGTDDFADDIYVESPDRTWGVCVTLPKGSELKRGETCRLRGVLSTDRFRLSAESVERHGQTQTIAPYGMANLYVGDGYRSSDKKKEISNLCLLVRTWGRVVSANAARQVFVIDDGSCSGAGAGLAVYFGSLRKPIDVPPKVGQYVGVTGVSTTWVDAQGRHIPAVRVRNGEDIQVLSGE